MAIGYGVAVPKPTKRKTLKGRKDRAEAVQKRVVRAECVERDGYCRIALALLDRLGLGRSIGDKCSARAFAGTCDGESEWAHMHARRRAQTRNQAPAVRHDPRYSLMLCRGHHAEYDAHRLIITALTRKGADGPLKFRRTK